MLTLSFTSFRLKASALFALALATLACRAPAQGHAEHLCCEGRTDPAGIDVCSPRLSWVFQTDKPRALGEGDSQSAYQILVADSAQALEAENGDLWDSGKVSSPDSVLVEYRGRALGSRQLCFWRVRVWDKSDRPSRWSTTAIWTVGLLDSSDWSAEWISDPILADVSNRPRTPINCYRSQLSMDPDNAKWIQFDLHSSRPLSSVNLRPARPAGLNADIRTVQFPKRFRIELAEDGAFKEASTVVDQTNADFSDPRSDNCIFTFAKHSARFLRITVTRLGTWDNRDYGVFLGPLEIISDGRNVAAEANVTCSDSVETSRWSKAYLTTQSSQVVFAAPPSALDTGENSQSSSRVALLRREMKIDGNVRRAMLYITARGFYEAVINGQRASDQLLAPGFTDYDTRISYQRLDVTSLVHPGANEIGVYLGYGWYAGHMNVAGNSYIYGYFPQLLAELEIEMSDGRRITLPTDRSWVSSLDGPIRWSDLLDGECDDFRRSGRILDSVSSPAMRWLPAWAQPRDATKLVWDRCPPVRQIEEITPVAIQRVAPGKYVIDMGREFSGWCRVTADGPLGAHVTIRHAENVLPDGSIDTQSLWGTLQREDYILDGSGSRVLEPHFTYHGFRYAEVTGLAERPTPETIRGIAIHSDLPSSGKFESSNELYNRLMAASRHTQENLFFDVPAGCAARSERLAWTGDIRPCVHSALFNFDSAPFFSKYLEDLRDAQTEDGRFTDICPRAHLRGSGICVGSPGWADAGVTLPWDLYVQSGDSRLLEQHYSSATRWVDWIHNRNPGLLWKESRGMDWGDWMSAGAATPKEIGSTAFFAHSADIVSKMAEALGNAEDALRYRRLFLAIRQKFAVAYLSPDGSIRNRDSSGRMVGPETQGSYALALQFGLLDGPTREKAANRLADLVVENGYHPTTGFWSSSELLLALSSNGKNDLAARLLNTRSCPSWGYMVDHGTTFWEAFDANTRGLSLNHWTHSAVAEWLWRNVAGLNPDPNSPGFKGFLVQPHPTKEVTWCRAVHESIRGPIRISWSESISEFQLELSVPNGSAATVILPDGYQASVTMNGRPIEASQVGPLVVGAGRYQFRSTRNAL